jgi:4-hydroxybenzoate polyprenyltransferase
MQNQGPEEKRLEALLKEYELSRTRTEGSQNRLVQLFSLAFLVLAAMATYLLNSNSPPVAIVWVAPFVGTLFCAYFLLVIYYAMASVFNTRILTERINRILGEADLITFEPDMPEALFFSAKRGNLKIKLIYFMLFGCGGFLVLLLAGISLSLIYPSNHLGGTMFVSIYAPLLALFLFAGTGILVDLPNIYRAFLTSEKVAGHIQQPGDFLKIAPRRFTLQRGWAWLMPRPKDFILKEVFVLYGFMMAWLSIGVQPEQLPVLNFLFREGTDWRMVSQVPGWAVVGLGIIYVLVAGVLLQQAKLLWDDIRDINRDKHLLQNKRRAIASGFITPKAAIWHVIVRVGLSFLFGYLLGGWPLLVLFLAIFLVQAMYELWGKPQGKKHPLVLVFLISFSTPLRFLVGAMAVVGSRWTWAPLIFALVLCYFWQFGRIAAFWHLEAKHYKDTKPPIRLQSPYYLHRGEHWQHIGLLAAILAATFLVAVQSVPWSCQVSVPVFEGLYKSCPAVSGSASYIEFGFLKALVLVGLLITLTTLISLALVTLSSRWGRRWAVRAIRVLQALGAFPLCVLLTLIFVVSAFVQWNVTLLFWAFLFLNVGYLVMYQDMSYEAYTLEKLGQQLSLLRAAGSAYLFRSIPGWSLSQVKNALSSNDPKLKALHQVALQLKNKGLPWCVYGEAAASAYLLPDHPPSSVTKSYITGPIQVFLDTDETAVVKELFPAGKQQLGQCLELPDIALCWSKLRLEANGYRYELAFDQQLLDRITPRVVAGIPAPVVPPEDVLVMKALLQRDQPPQSQSPAIHDMEDIKVLVEALRDDLDMGYLRNRAAASQEFQQISQCLGNFGITL